MSKILDDARAWVADEAALQAKVRTAQHVHDRAFVRAASELPPHTLLIMVSAPQDGRAIAVRTGTTDRALAAYVLRKAANFLESGGGIPFEF